MSEARRLTGSPPGRSGLWFVALAIVAGLAMGCTDAAPKPIDPGRLGTGGSSAPSGTGGTPGEGTGGSAVSPTDASGAPSDDAPAPAGCGAGCAMGERCLNGACLPCGGINQPCCVNPPGQGGGGNGISGGTCGMGFRCTSQGGNNTPSICLACGGMAQVCCTGNLCNAPLGCISGGNGGTCGACGNAGEACCGGEVRCNGANLRCTTMQGQGSKCSACGGMGEPCCANSTCTGGLGCVDTGSGPGVCGQCGGAGQPCCNGMSKCSMPGLRCSETAQAPDGQCAPCGGKGQICCQGSMCTGGLGCIDTGNGPDTCGECGGMNQPCCAGNVKCQGMTLRCLESPQAPDGACVPCGGMNQACCANSTCNKGLGCADPGAGTGVCTTCGTKANGACCAGDNCASGFACVAPAGADGGVGAGSCKTCGGPNQPCCADDTCSRANLRCIDDGPGPGSCKSCGAENQVCCIDENDDPKCNGDLECMRKPGDPQDARRVCL